MATRLEQRETDNERDPQGMDDTPASLMAPLRVPDPYGLPALMRANILPDGVRDRVTVTVTCVVTSIVK